MERESSHTITKSDRSNAAQIRRNLSEPDLLIPSESSALGISLDHLDRMTDSTGLIQHAIYSIPRRESGYTIDDNARSLRLCTRLWCKHPTKRMLGRITNYLSLLEYARRPVGGFHNFLSYQRQWLTTDSDGDCQGQAVRALAEVLGSNLPNDFRMLARELIDTVLPVLADLRSIRAQAYVILAWGHLRSVGVKNVETLENVAWSAAQRLVECYQRSKRPGWQWFESRMTYANAVLPHALFIAAQHWPRESFLEVARDSFAFLDQKTTAVAPEIPSLTTDHCPLTTVFWPIGNSGWYPHGEEKSLYDQQPVEAGTMAEAALAAFGLLGEPRYLGTFHRARDWFHGQNSLCQTLVDVRSGSCCDGLQLSGVNRNQGAESTLAYLWTEMHNSEAGQLPPKNSAHAPITGEDIQSIPSLIINH